MTSSKGNKHPANFVFWDTETERDEMGNHHLLMVAFTFGGRIPAEEVREDLPVEVAEDLGPLFAAVRRFEHKKGPVYCFCHNLGFDSRAAGLLEAAKKAGLVLSAEKSWRNEGSSCLFFTMGQKPVIFLDTVNFYGRTRLRTIGDRIGLAKGHLPQPNAEDGALAEYARQDVRVLARAVFDYLDAVEGSSSGSFKPTIAGQAWERLRYRLADSTGHLRGIEWHDVAPVRELEKSAYFGGRCEAFRVGTYHDCTTLDVVSMYGTVLSSITVPGRLVRFEPRYTNQNLLRVLEEFCVVAHVTLQVDPSVFVPPYPVRTREGVLYPTGRFTTSLCTEGLRYAIERGDLLHVHQLSVYEKTNVLQSYAAELLDLIQRAEDRPNHRAIFKRLLNSVTGRFARKRIEVETTEYPFPGDVIYDTHRKGFVSRLGDETVVSWQYDEPHKWSYHAIAAHITEAARFRMLKLYQKYQPFLLYTDTDSLILDGVFHSSGSRPGLLKTESQWETLEVIREKYYQGVLMDGSTKRVCSGIPINAVCEDSHTYTFQVWDCDIRKNEKPRTVEVTSTVSTESKKRKRAKLVGACKTFPIHLEEV